VHVRVELAVGCDEGEPLMLEELLELTVDEPHALLELRLLVLLGGLERPLEVIQNGQELLDDPLAGPRDQRFLVALGPLAIVLEVGLEALKRVDQLLVLVPKSLQLGDFRRGLLDFLAVLDLFGHHAFFASSSSSITS
jgi:hypothetical protein